MSGYYGDFAYRTGSANQYVTGTGAYQPTQRAVFQSRATQQQEVVTTTTEEAPKKRRTGWIIFWVIAGVVLLIIIGVVIFFLLRGSSSNNNNNTDTGGVLNDPCSASVPCQAVLFSCQDGQCKSITGGPCPAGDADCYQGQFASTCVSQQCRRNSGQTCNQNFQCVTGSCQTGFCAPCTVDANCSTGSVCNILTGVCAADT